ncbi:hypothetical protein TL16_g09616 [Triparma laevis f. inornata]|uniref:Uncharacterized protein n=2 Tax=Triparma laevis TaxID=1534972 RepID=A0A9W7BXJ5_9STRA|nr:hypothetical protein TL16_g09616 [Triparma laevis f. inornata]GMH99341.1 hypothetical protein TrLO_g14565 [Triparma laevis f. longispina]
MQDKLQILTNLESHINVMKSCWDKTYKTLLQERRDLKESVFASLTTDVDFIVKRNTYKQDERDVKSTVEEQKSIYLDIFESISEDIEKKK